MSSAPQPLPLERDVETFAPRVLFAVGAVALLLLVVYLRAVMVLAFGSVLVAVALRTSANAVRRVSPLSERAALAAVVLGMLAALAVGIVMLGRPVGEQFDALRNALPGAFEAATHWFNSHEVGLWLLRWWHNVNSDVEWTKLAGLFGSTLGALGSALLMMVVGLYLAADPGLYLRGLLQLLPRRLRARVAQALAAAGHGLARWLLGQAVAMLLVGLMTAVGLAAIGMPLALPLGIIAGLVEFVPFFGPIASAALIVLLAFAQGASQAAYAALVCFVVQHVEGYVIQPFVQRWAIALPPALGLISVIVFGLLFGTLGVLFAVPLMVVLMILVQELYVDAPRIATPAAVAQEPRLPSTASTGSPAGAAAPDHHARDSE
ncbi:MAG TPA: AI-2E family transporter [Burkholderiaceae bacterium]|nr:AI-2E family transporter [Burkholderiaceae bacterium]